MSDTRSSVIHPSLFFATFVPFASLRFSPVSRSDDGAGAGVGGGTVGGGLAAGETADGDGQAADALADLLLGGTGEVQADGVPRVAIRREGVTGDEGDALARRLH